MQFNTISILGCAPQTAGRPHVLLSFGSESYRHPASPAKQGSGVLIVRLPRARLVSQFFHIWNICSTTHLLHELWLLLSDFTRFWSSHGCPVFKIATVAVFCVFNTLLLMAPSADTIALLSNDLAAVRTQGAALPLPLHDPCPRATLALHLLWQQLRPIVRLTPNAPVLAAIASNPAGSAARSFQIFGAHLVSASFVALLPYSFLTHFLVVTI